MIEDTKVRTDHGAQTIRLSYEEWFPIVNIRPDGSLDGIMPRISKSFCAMLNLTPEFVRVRDPSGGMLPNGTFTGDLGDIKNNVVDASIWGYVETLERRRAADFTYSFGKFILGVLVRRPRSGDVSMNNYVKEYPRLSWHFIVLTNIVFWTLFFFLLSCQPDNKRKNGENLVTAGTMMLRTFINKVYKVFRERNYIANHLNFSSGKRNEIQKRVPQTGILLPSINGCSHNALLQGHHECFSECKGV